MASATALEGVAVGLMEQRQHHSSITLSSANRPASGVAPTTTTTMIANINSPSVSLASVSSDGSAESHVVEPEEMVALTGVR